MSGSSVPGAPSVWVFVVFLVTTAAAARGVWSPCGLSMVSAINPFTERSRGHRYWLTAAWFVAGSVAGGAVLGALAVLGAVVLSPLPAASALLAGVACCLLALAADSERIPVRLPNHPRQVNEHWLGRYRRWVYAAGFGVQIGCGFATYIMTAAVYLTVVLAALSSSPALAAAAGLTFGLVRGLAVLLSSTARAPAHLQALHRRLEALAPWSLRAVMLIEALAAGMLGFALGGAAGLAGVLLLAAAGAAVVASSRRRPITAASCEVDATAGHRTLTQPAMTTEGEAPSWAPDRVRSAGRR